MRVDLGVLARCLQNRIVTPIEHMIKDVIISRLKIYINLKVGRL